MSRLSPSPGKSPGGKVRGTANADGKQLEDLLHAASALRARWSVTLGGDSSGPDPDFEDADEAPTRSGVSDPRSRPDRETLDLALSPAGRAPVSSSVVRVTRDHLARTRQELDALRAEHPITYSKGSSSRPRTAPKLNYSASPISNTRSPDPFGSVRSPMDGLKSPASEYKAAPPRPSLAGEQGDSPKELRAALAELEAQLLKAKGDLLREKEDHKASKARLAVEMQARLRSAEAAMLESHTALRERLKKAEADLDDTQKQLQAERRSGALQEAELEELVMLRERVRKADSPAEREMREVIATLERRLAAAKEELHAEQDGHRAERRRSQELESTITDLRDEVAKLQILLRATEDDLARERTKAQQPNEAVRRAQEAINALEDKLNNAETTAQAYGRQLQALKEQGMTQEQGLKQKLERANWEVDKVNKDLAENKRMLHEILDKAQAQQEETRRHLTDSVERVKTESKGEGERLRRELREAVARAQTAEERLLVTHTEGKATKAELGRVQGDLEAAQERERDARAKIERLTKELLDEQRAGGQARADLERLQVSAEAAQKELHAAERRATELREEQERIAEREGRLRKDLDRATWELERANRELDSSKRNLNDSLEKVQTSSQQQAEEDKQRLARNEWELERANEELNDIKRQLQSALEKARSTSQEREALLRSDNESLKGRLDRAEWELERATKEVADTRSRLSEALERVKQLAAAELGEVHSKEAAERLARELAEVRGELLEVQRRAQRAEDEARERDRLREEGRTEIDGLRRALEGREGAERGLSESRGELERCKAELEKCRWELDKAERELEERDRKLHEAAEKAQAAVLQMEKDDIKVNVLEERVKAGERDREADRQRFKEELEQLRETFQQGSAENAKGSAAAREMLEAQHREAQAELRSVSLALEQALEKLKQERIEAQRIAALASDSHGTQKAMFESQMEAQAKEVDAARTDLVQLRKEMAEAEARSRSELDSSRQTAETFKAEADALKGQLERLRARQEEMMGTMGDLKNLLAAQAERAVASERQLAEREVSWREASHRAQDEIAALRLQVLEAEGRFRAQPADESRSALTPARTPNKSTATQSESLIIPGSSVRPMCLELELGGVLLSEVDDLSSLLHGIRCDLARAAQMPEGRVKVKGVRTMEGGFVIIDVEMQATRGLVSGLQNQIGVIDSELMLGEQTEKATALRVVQSATPMAVGSSSRPPVQVVRMVDRGVDSSTPPPSRMVDTGVGPARAHQMDRAVGISPIKIDRSVDASPSKVDRGQDVGVNDQSVEETLELSRALDAKNKLINDNSLLLEKREIDVRKLEEGLIRSQLSQEAALAREQAALAKLEAARERERLYEGAEVALERLRGEKRAVMEEAGSLREQLSEARSELVGLRVGLDKLRGMEGELERAKEELNSLRRVRVELMSARSELEERNWQLTERASRAAADRVALEEEMEHWRNAASDRNALREDVEHWRAAASEVLVLKQQVEDLKKVAAERVPIEERDALLKAAADRVSLDEEVEYLKRQLSDMEALRADVEHWRRKASEGLALRHQFEAVRMQAEESEQLRSEVNRWKALAESRTGIEDEVERWRREANTFEVEVREIREAMQSEVQTAREHIRRLEEERLGFDQRLEHASVETEEIKTINDKLSEKIREMHEQLQEQQSQKSLMNAEFKRYKGEMSRHLGDVQKGNPELANQLAEALRITTEARNEAELYGSRARAAERRVEEREKALEQIRSAAEDTSNRFRGLERQVASLSKDKAALEEQVESLRQKLEAERSSARRVTHDAEGRWEEIGRKAREENDALRRELRAQAHTISSMQEAAIAAASQASQQGLSEEAVRALERRISQLQAEKGSLAGELAWEREETERLRGTLLKRDAHIAMQDEQIRVLRGQEALRSHTHSPPRSLRASPARSALMAGSLSPPTLSLGTPGRAPAPRGQRSPPELPNTPFALPSQPPMLSPHAPPRPESPAFYDDFGLISEASLTPRRNAFVHSMVPEVGGTFATNPQLLHLSSAKPTYYGELEDGWPHGRGITVWADGRVYDGHWIRGVFSGMGTCVWYNGDTYEGEWHDGFAHGLGRYTFANGDAYEGSVHQDKFHGHGAFIHNTGWKYRGGWDNGMMHGWGLVIPTSGEKIKLHFIRGRPSSTGQEASDELYSQMLMAVSEVVTTVRQQTQAIRESRARAKNILMAKEANKHLTGTSPPGAPPPWRTMFPPVAGDRTAPPGSARQQLQFPQPQPMGGMSPGAWGQPFPGEVIMGFRSASMTPRMPGSNI